MTKGTICMIFWMLCTTSPSICAPQKETDAQAQPMPEGATGPNAFTASLNRLRAYASSGDMETLLKEALKIMKSEPTAPYVHHNPYQEPQKLGTMTAV